MCETRTVKGPSSTCLDPWLWRIGKQDRRLDFHSVAEFRRSFLYIYSSLIRHRIALTTGPKPCSTGSVGALHVCSKSGYIYSYMKQ